MNKKLYQQIATLVDARLRCIETNNDFAETHEQTLEYIKDLLPSGSGIDCGTQLNLADSKPDRLVLHLDYHHMNDGGMYDGWNAYTVYVTPSLISGFDLRITGKDRNDVKSYLYEVYRSALEDVVEWDDETKKYYLPSMREAAEQFQAGVKAGTII